MVGFRRRRHVSRGDLHIERVRRVAFWAMVGFLAAMLGGLIIHVLSTPLVLR